MNLNQEDVAGGVIRDRQRIGSSLADVDPMTIDTNVSCLIPILEGRGCFVLWCFVFYCFVLFSYMYHVSRIDQCVLLLASCCAHWLFL